MGAQAFVTVSRGETAQDAFVTAVQDAQYENGHGGYTGTIAEKNTFKVIDPPKGFDIDNPIRSAFDLIEGYGSRPTEFWDDKWSSAACVELGEGKYVFFGWASS